MKFDEMLIILGGFGKYQKIRFFPIWLFSVISAWHALNMVFVGPDHKFRCDLSEVNLTNTPLENVSLSMKYEMFLIDDEEKACFQYDVNQTMTSLIAVGYNWSSVAASKKRDRSMISCRNGYTFSKEMYRSTITSEFNLVCDKKFLRTMAKSIYFAGRLVGAVIFGQLSDIFGRRPMILTAVLLLLMAGTMASLANSMALFLSMYFLQGAAFTGAFLVAYTLATELVGPKYRVMAAFISLVFNSFGDMGLAGIAYLIRDWRHLEATITAPAVLFGIIYYWYLPESVRWLLTHNKDEKAEEILMTAAKENGVTLSSDLIKQLKEDPSIKSSGRKYYVLDCVRTWPMARLSLNIWFNWIVNSLVYYGLSLNTENLAGNNYLNFCVAGAVEVPAFFFCLLLLNKVGRRGPLILMMYLGGIACILSGLIPTNGDPGMNRLVVILAMIGKFGITASYSIIYLMTAEIFPTVIRNIGMGMASMSSRIGGILVPIILDLKTLYKPLPLVVFGGMSILAGSLAYLLPETTGKPLPQLPEDVEKIKSCFDSLPCCRSEKYDVKEREEIEDDARV